MTCRATGRRPRKQRILVAPGSSPLWDTFSGVPVHRVSGGTVESPRVKPGCALTALAGLSISAGVVGGALYWAFCVARAVWS